MCKSRHGGSLVSIHGPSKNTRVGQVAGSVLGQKSFWIGIEKRDGFGWSDGSAVNYENWRIGEPDQQKRCAQYDLSGKWATVECTQNSPFVCQIPRPQSLCNVNEMDRIYADGVTMYQCMGDGNCWDGKSGEGQSMFSTYE